MRLFIAVAPDAGIREHLAAFIGLCRKIRDVKWTLPMNMHLTLLFLGDVEEGRTGWIVEELQAAVAGVEPFAARLDVTGLFNRRDSAILWAGASQAAKLEQLAGRVRERLHEFDDRKPFKAHITLGRARGKIEEPAFRAVPWTPVDYPVRGVELIKSVLYPEGPVYSRVAEILFRAMPS